MKKAFSVLELIFVLTIISIVAIVSMPKILTILDSSKLIKIKSDISLIRAGINRVTTKYILKNDGSVLNTLDTDEKLLFNKVLKTPIVQNTTHSIGNWEKLSNTSYKVWLNSTQSLTFIYDVDTHSFDCDKDEDRCIEFSQ